MFGEGQEFPVAPGKPRNGDSASTCGQQGTSKDFQMGAEGHFSSLVPLEEEISGCLCMNQEHVSLFLGRIHGSKLQRLQFPSWDFLPGGQPGERETCGCFFLSFSCFFWPRCVACGILVPRPGIEPLPPALGAQSPNHWTAREVPKERFGGDSG